MRRLEEARHFASEHGLEGRLVFFNEWVPYEERQNYLLEADLGISAHSQHAEARLSFRTRLLDCIWAGLPMVCSSGDVLGDLVEKESLGRTVAPGDSRGMTVAILNLLDDEGAYQEARKHIGQVAKKMSWEHAVKPLLSFCSAPYYATDHSNPSCPNPTATEVTRPGDVLARMVLKAADIYLREGPKRFFRKAWHKSTKLYRRGR